MAKKYWLFASLGILALLADQLTKSFFQNNQGFLLIIWKPLLFFQFTSNQNIAFGLPVNILIFTIFFIVIFILMVYLLTKTYQRKELLQFSLIVFILAGAIGNIIDRLRFGYVIDFIHIPFWSVFNLADIYIVVSVIIWMIYLIFYETRKKVPKKN